MYLLKPKEGFVVPIIYINKEAMDIFNIEEYDFAGNSNKDMFEQEIHRNESIVENKNDKLVFDIDLKCDDNLDSASIAENRIVEEVKSESVGILIFDEDDSAIEVDSDAVVDEKIKIKDKINV